MHQSLRLENFTVFKSVEMSFCPGINVFVGENGTGKTHALKVLYAGQNSGSDRFLVGSVETIFLVDNFQHLIRQGTPHTQQLEAMGRYGSHTWHFDIQSLQHRSPPQISVGVFPLMHDTSNSVFIPAMDMLGHTRGFLQADRMVKLDFDSTYGDIVTLLTLERKDGDPQNPIISKLASLLGGDLEYDENIGRFFLSTPQGRIAAPLMAEGIRKIATLYRLARNGWLAPGTTLFWDEPEVNLNPKLMDEVVESLLILARSGVQVFLATHSYIILKELDLQAKSEDSVRYFGFQNTPDGVVVNATDEMALLEPNPILEQYNSLYDRELTRATGRNRNGERVHRE